MPASVAQQSGQGLNSTLATLSGTLVSLQGQAQNFAAENTELQSLNAANGAAAGRLQALQIGNQIALLQAQQEQMLRQTMLTLTNALAVTQANKASQEAQGLATLQQATTGMGAETLTPTSPEALIIGATP